jgi:thiol-disulfide isomerase/thioredoxin
MKMKVQLLVSEWCVPCRGAEAVWRAVAQEKDFVFEVLDVGQPEGRSIVARLGVRTVPATVIDDVLKCVGVPSVKEARDFVAGAPDREAGSVQYVGLSMDSTSRWALAGAAVYLAAAGAALVFDTGIVGEAPWRGAAIHLFALGFAVFFIFGLGEHMLPRFAGAPIRGGAAAWVQQGLAHVGVILLVVGLAASQRVLAFAGGTAAWAALALFTARLTPVLRRGRS